MLLSTKNGWKSYAESLGWQQTTNQTLRDQIYRALGRTYLRWLDHPINYRRAGCRALLVEPYGLAADDEHDILAAARLLNLTIDLDERYRVHHPKTTPVFLFQK